MKKKATKRFDKDLYDQFDKPGKKFAASTIKRSGLEVRPNDNRVAVDLIVSKDGKDIFYVEVEIKKYIKPGQKFRFETLNILQRKSKYCNLDLPTLFMLFSECGRTFLCVWDKYVLESEQEEVSNKYMREGEKFFKVDISKVDDSIEKALKRKNK